MFIDRFCKHTIIMKKIFKKIAQILCTDKGAHALGGLVIAQAVTLTLAHFFATEDVLPIAAGIAVATVAGFIKEWWDERHNGTCDVKDFIATVVGGLIGEGILFI